MKRNEQNISGQMSQNRCAVRQQLGRQHSMAAFSLSVSQRRSPPLFYSFPFLSTTRGKQRATVFNSTDTLPTNNGLVPFFSFFFFVALASLMNPEEPGLSAFQIHLKANIASPYSNDPWPHAHDAVLAGIQASVVTFGPQMQNAKATEGERPTKPAPFSP
ncbi:hypothetical protein LZ31DRAFT_121593 [Colletotrichum somersetense]|nr:hypothetical protein LZ31DRAFT_121593 [Colletotrichum somersetense]